MRRLPLSLALAAGLALAGPAPAQDNVGNVITGIAQSLLAQELDRAAYAEAVRIDTAASYRAYLERHPRGLHRAEAEQALARLGVPLVPVPAPAPETGPAAVEAALGLTRNQRIEIQRQLTALGHDTRGADGLWGRNTRAAIAGWQGANGVTATGYLNAREVAMIGEQARRPGTRPDTGRPQGDAEREERALGLSIAERREVQLRLTLLGHDTRGTDGDFGQSTRRALADWQRTQGEPATGFLTADQVRALRRQTRG